MLHEAFCLYEHRDIFKPYEKHHATALDACRTGAELNVKNVVLYHTEDKYYDKRKELYTREGSQAFDGGLFVPDDLDVIVLA